MSKTKPCPHVAAGTIIQLAWNSDADPPQWQTTLPCGKVVGLASLNMECDCCCDVLPTEVTITIGPVSRLLLCLQRRSRQAVTIEPCMTSDCPCCNDRGDTTVTPID